MTDTWPHSRPRAGAGPAHREQRGRPGGGTYGRLPLRGGRHVLPRSSAGSGAQPGAGPAPVVRVGLRTALVLLLVSLAGLAMFCWPLLMPPTARSVGHSADAPLLFVLIMPMLLAVVLAEMSSGGIDPKALAMLGVLCALNAGLRPLGAGTAGIETVFFLLVLAGRVFGPGFGFVLGSLSLFASALLTAGVGPWLPFQMLASGWIGLGAGLLPRRISGRAEIAMLAVYGVLVAYVFGFLMNMWFWPFTAGADTQLSFQAGAPVLENLHRFAVFTLVTSTFGWDTGRALTNLAAILLTGPAVLAVLRRAAHRAAFDAPVVFGASTGRAPAPPPEPAGGHTAADTEGDSV
ncbi:ECF transporter S component [Streptomyces sp. WMMB303]|uniref:ECF transporter S component n=1 Tax=Streptomyces sp. WMMB303 TaxID=3034154 RepID=UPI0023ED2EF9|nr:ECF transporter S component [Streptomyces sp. WMMB303]MDF4251884.1 ECF transporter S component [Streptomyces sp. WMMB303]